MSAPTRQQVAAWSAATEIWQNGVRFRVDISEALLRRFGPCVECLVDLDGYLSAIEEAANQIGERSAIQAKRETIRQALASAERSVDP